MNKNQLLLGLLSLTLVMALGCANIVHNRTVTVNPDGTRTTQESESARFFLEKEAAQKISSATHDSPTNYSHVVTASGVQVTGDTDLVNAIGNQVNKAFVNGAAIAGKMIVP
jgi:hypothetical protein